MKNCSTISATLIAILFMASISSPVMAEGRGFSLKTDDPSKGVELTTGFTRHYQDQEGRKTFNFDLGLALQSGLSSGTHASDRPSAISSHNNPAQQNDLAIEPMIAMGLSWTF
jgi:hypothetical protein